eukprot:COSAG06_NODE_4386_length_4311_cov_41.952991_3_plen_111_part_00
MLIFIYKWLKKCRFLTDGIILERGLKILYREGAALMKARRTAATKAKVEKKKRGRERALRREEEAAQVAEAAAERERLVQRNPLAGAKTPLFAPFIYINECLTKTGSGQT